MKLYDAYVKWFCTYVLLFINCSIHIVILIQRQEYYGRGNAFKLHSEYVSLHDMVFYSCKDLGK